MEKQRRTFLSYSRVNKDFAIKLAKELKAEGLPVWLDQLDIPPGSRWDVEVEKALVECDIFMVIITQASSTSENVLDEIGYAIDNGKRMLPVLLEKSNIPLRLRRFQYVDFTDKNFDDGVQSAKELLRNLIAQPTIPRMKIPDELREQPSKEEAEPLVAQTYEPAEKVPVAPIAPLRQEQAEKAKAKEQITQDKILAVPVPAPSSSRSKQIGIFGIAILAIAIVGFLTTRFLSGGSRVNTPGPTRDLSASLATEPAVPVISNTSTPTAEAPTATESPTPTEEEAPTETPTESVTATPSFEIVDDKGAGMVLVPEGEFQMGSGRGLADEQPVHTVYLDAFYIDKYEVTNQLYKACVDDGSCEPPRQTYFFVESPNRIYYGNPQYDNYPVIYVDWNMAKAYCEWRDARLLTEAEWEKAARGTEGNTYPWGRDLDCQKANYQNCVNRTSEVGIYEDGKSPYGVYDMTGNVWEWVADWYSQNYYATSPRNNPTGPIVGQSRVLRGGSWPRFDVTAYHRSNFGAEYNTFDIGFRCARDITP
jgi:formylglycine-generating enzyme required for sulfatase activity